MSRRAMAPAGILAASLAMVSLTACTRDYTLAYMYVTTSKSSPGVINQFTVDYQSGAVVQYGTPVTAGNNPIASVAAPNAQSIYVVNQGDSTVQQFAVGDNGALTAKTAYPTGGNLPTAVAINPAGTFLYVTYTNGFNVTNPSNLAMNPLASTNTPVMGGLAVFPINSDGSLGAPTNLPTGVGPVGVAMAPFNNTVYVVDQGDLNSSPVIQPIVQAFSVSTSGALTPMAGTATETLTTAAGTTTASGYAAGVQPSAVAEDPTGRFVYVTDQAANQLIGYTVQAGGSIVAMVNGPFATQQYPLALTVDPRGAYVYVANYNSRTVSAYALNSSSGAPSAVAGTTITTDPNPVSVTIDPALGVYLYTANNLASTVTGQTLNANTGALTAIQNTPFPTSGTPTSIAIVANGSHPTMLLQP